MPRARKRLHGKRRKRSSCLKQRISGISSNNNPYANSGSVQFGSDLKASVDKFNKNYKPSRNKEQATTKNNDNTEKWAQDFGKESLKKKLVKEGVKN